MDLTVGAVLRQCNGSVDVNHWTESLSLGDTVCWGFVGRVDRNARNVLETAQSPGEFVVSPLGHERVFPR
jgi:hypothetical protein